MTVMVFPWSGGAPHTVLTNEITHADFSLEPGKYHVLVFNQSTTCLLYTSIKVQIINKGHQPLPAFATPQSAGMDLRANIDEAIVLHPMERRLVPTGLYMALPAGYEAQIRPRSGLALKHGITVLNTPGTIDADYRGEIMVLLINFSTEDFVINDGERIAQMVLAKHEQCDFIEVNELDETERGAGGYGHTGVK